MDEWQPLSLDSLIPISSPRDYDTESFLDANDYLFLNMPLDIATLDNANSMFLGSKDLGPNKAPYSSNEANEQVEKVSSLGPDQPMSRDLYYLNARTINSN